MPRQPSRIGHVPGYPPGSTFPDRATLSEAGVHRPNQAGICGTAERGAESIVLSGGYADDIDLGDVVIYTGAGGQDRDRGIQYADQVLSNTNKALAVSSLRGQPVRIVRGWKLDSPHRPASGYRYDGLFRVTSFWQEKGRDGFLVWRYRMERAGDARLGVAEGLAPQRPLDLPSSVHTLRVVWTSQAAGIVRVRHDDRCQLCGHRIESVGGTYAEPHWLRPLGKPHDGFDEEANVLCLCPTHAVGFGLGAFVASDDGAVRDALTGASVGGLRHVAGHRVDPANFAYHRGMFLPRG